MDFTRIQAVSFDVGGTLIEPWPSVGHVYAAVAHAAGLGEWEPALLTDRFNKAWREKARFDYSRQSWAALVASAFGGPSEHLSVASPFFGALYDRFTDADVWRIYDDVPPALEALTRRGLTLAVVSNWDDRLRPLLRNLGLDAFFQVIEVSAESGFHKPAPEIFLRAATALGIAPGAILHVGDSSVEDLQGAQAAGLNAVLLRRGVEQGSASEICSLSTLCKLFGASSA